MKRKWLSWLMCLCIGAFSVGVTACKDDDEASNSQSQQSGLESTEASSDVGGDGGSDDTPDSGDGGVHIHSWVEDRVTTQPTCTTVGVKVLSCGCGESKTEEIPVLKHTYVNGECTCGRKVSIGLKYTLTSDGYAVTGKGTCEDTDIVIPSTYEDLPVTSIGKRAFYKCESLTSVEIPDSVTSIGEAAFYDCSGLTSIEIPDSVTSIGRDVFFGCDSLTEITLPFVGENGDGSDYVGYIFASGGYKVEGHWFPNYLPASLKTVTVTGGVIGEEAFVNCDSLTSVVIGNGVTSIGEYAFGKCDSLTSITVLENNTVYCSIEGDLYSKDRKELIQYAIGKNAKEFIIPDSVTVVGAYAFAYAEKLENVTISGNVTTILYGAFGRCSGLTSVNVTNR